MSKNLASELAASTGQVTIVGAAAVSNSAATIGHLLWTEAILGGGAPGDERLTDVGRTVVTGSACATGAAPPPTCGGGVRALFCGPGVRRGRGGVARQVDRARGVDGVLGAVG
jgi:hypothetical protein